MIKPDKNIAFIFARGGSKGLIRKNIKKFNGKPLIAWTIELALKTKIFEEVIVSTDNQEIAEISMQYGARVPFIRPDDLASDTANEWFAWKHAVQNLDYNEDYNFVCLPCVCPLRNEEDVIKSIEAYMNKTADLVFTISQSDRSPYVNMVEIDKDQVKLSKPINSNKIYRRQDSPKVYNIVPSVYVTSPKYILENESLWSGRISYHEVPHARSIDIDSELDFEFARMLSHQE
ncbi:MAG: acylneuraminate cytidylyltransferase family protein [Methylophilaceae bacterium]|nr:acylneuraminate cytidylyltransferase family protein [Methylophilaceae bacterium]